MSFNRDLLGVVACIAVAVALATISETLKTDDEATRTNKLNKSSNNSEVSDTTRIT